MRLAGLAVGLATIVAGCATGEGRIVDGVPVGPDGWPQRPAELRFRCPEGTTLNDARAPSGRRTATCRAPGNPLPRGFQLTWSESGTLVSKFEFTQEGVPVSRMRWFDDGDRAAEEQYEGGKLVRRLGWYVNGAKKLEMTYDAEDQLLRVRRYQPDGSIEAAGQMREGTRIGEWEEWRDGAVTTLTYVDGVPHGDVVRRYPTGGVERGKYQAGKKHGLWVREDSSGNPVREIRFERGDREGVFRLFHPNTQLREEGRYLDGEKHGPWKTWHPSGELRSEAWYSCGTLVGPYREYFSDGDPKVVGTYEEGRTVGEWKTYNDGGIVTQIDQYNPPSDPFSPAQLPDQCR